MARPVLARSRRCRADNRIISAQSSQKTTRIVLVGDSTVTDDSGWGSGFRHNVTEAVEVVNTAANGRSSKSFIDEGRWAEALAKRGRYYLIQFGHNDEPGKGPERETDPADHLPRQHDSLRRRDARHRRDANSRDLARPQALQGRRNDSNDADGIRRGRSGAGEGEERSADRSARHQPRGRRERRRRCLG